MILISNRNFIDRAIKSLV